MVAGLVEGGAVVVGQNYNKSGSEGYWERTILEIDCTLLGSTFGSPLCILMM